MQFHQDSYKKLNHEIDYVITYFTSLSALLININSGRIETIVIVMLKVS